MINLLPPFQKEELEREEHLKSILISGVVFLAFLCSFFLILFSIKNILLARLEIQKIILEQEKKQLEIFRIENLEGDIKKYNLQLSKLVSFYQNQVPFTEALEKISQTIPPNAYLTNLSLNLVSEEKYIAKVSLSGFCPSREELIQLKENLEKEKSFAEIDFPTSNWLSPESFVISFKIKK
jgi:Tfp pilus assembly protein PilN